MKGIPGPYPIATKVGDVEVVAIADVTIILEENDTEPDADVEGHRGEVPTRFGPRGWSHLPVTCFLLRSSGQTILFDTGVGSRGAYGVRPGSLDLVLDELEVGTEEVDVVVNSHLHFDHVGWNTIEGPDGRFQTFFPRARYLINRVEWETTMVPEKLHDPDYDHLRFSVAPLEASGQLVLIEPGYEITPEVEIIATPGHTHGHVAARIHSGGETATLTGDASHLPAQLRHPAWSPLGDTDPELATATRRELFELLADDDHHRICAAHWPYPGIGRVASEDGAFAFRAT